LPSYYNLHLPPFLKKLHFVTSKLEDDTLNYSHYFLFSLSFFYVTHTITKQWWCVIFLFTHWPQIYNYNFSNVRLSLQYWFMLSPFIFFYWFPKHLIVPKLHLTILIKKIIKWHVIKFYSYFFTIVYVDKEQINSNIVRDSIQQLILNLVNEPNELYLRWKLNLLTKFDKLNLSIILFVSFMSLFDSVEDT